jgi:mercuric ion transport protein
MTPKRQLVASVAGTVAVALCYFTPILVVLLAGIGLGALTPYLDLVLIPALAILIVVTGLSYRRYVRATKAEHEIR